MRMARDSAKWHKRHMGLAMHVADWSKDPSTKVGAVVVGVNPKKLTIGYNGFPEGIEDAAERLNDRPTKYKLMQHAERNALDNAEFDLRGGTLVTTMFPCVECAKSIVSRGIACVVTPPPPESIEVESWRDTVNWSQMLFQEAGIAVVELSEGPAAKAELPWPDEAAGD